MKKCMSGVIVGDGKFSRKSNKSNSLGNCKINKMKEENKTFQDKKVVLDMHMNL